MDWTELDTYRLQLAKEPETWQFDLLNAKQFFKFAEDKKIRVFSANEIIDLWRIGLLRADVVASEKPIKISSLISVSENEGEYLYADTRPVCLRASGYGGAFSARSPDLENLHPYFHPFRLYVLYHIVRVFQYRLSATQYLSYPSGFTKILDYQVESLDNWASTESFVERFEYWNRTAEFSIIFEPVSYRRVYQSIRWRIPGSREDTEKRIENWRGRLQKLLASLSRETLKDIREDLCFNADIIDPNKTLHVLLRLMKNDERSKLKGHLGACLLFKDMAEVIRRAYEEATQEFLPEEDELGLGEWMNGARKILYGTERILDATPSVRREFLTQMGLDAAIKVRCYLEGDTEFGAIRSAIGESDEIEIVNLQGQVIQSKRKGLGFLESLKNDIKSAVFSIVLLDSDSQDNIRALKKAAKAGDFFGRFFVMTPDIEMANFTIHELVQIYRKLAEDQEMDVLAESNLLLNAGAAKSGEEFFSAVSDSKQQRISKGYQWGVALMDYAISQPQFAVSHPKAGQTRPIIEVARFILNARRGGYLLTAARYNVDTETGELRKKLKQLKPFSDPDLS